MSGGGNRAACLICEGTPNIRSLVLGCLVFLLFFKIYS